jgi:hypothetical protein
MLFVRTLVFCLFSLALAACSYPGTKEIAEFSDGAATVSTLAKSAAALDVELDAKAKAAQVAVEFSKGPKKGDYRNEFPPPPGRFIGGKSDKDWAARVAVLNAMIAYAKSIKAVADPTQGAQVRDALSGLSVALTNFAAASAAEIEDASRSARAIAEAQRIEAMGQIVAVAAAYAVNAYAAMEIRQVMHRVHPTLEELGEILTKDFKSLGRSIENKRKNYARMLRDKLEVHHLDDTLSSAQKYELYMTATAEMGTLAERVEVVVGLPKAIADLVKAHADLKNNVNEKQALVEFLAFVQELAAKVRKFQEVDRALRAA